MPGRCTTISFSDLLDPQTRSALGAVFTRSCVPRFLDGPPDEPDDELTLFANHDNFRGVARGSGMYVGDEAERRSRRLDMRGPLDQSAEIEAGGGAPEPDAVFLEFNTDHRSLRSLEGAPPLQPRRR